MGNSSTTIIYILLISILGYFIYGHSMDSAIGIFLLNVTSTFSMLLGLIPFAGFMFTYMINTQYLFPYIYSLTGIYDTWLTNLIWWISETVSLILTIITTAIILGMYKLK